MPLIKDNKFVPDRWATLSDDERLPAQGHAIVGLERWRSEREALLGAGVPLGIRLRSDQPPSLIAEDLACFAVIALEFPKFTDGRAYTYARLLRERYGYRGELRAVGNVLRDQFQFMVRCGFDAFEVADGAPLEDWLKALSEISVWYQPASDRRTPVSALRRGRDGNGAASTAEDDPAGDEEPSWSPSDREVARHEVPGLSAAPEPCTTHWAY